MSTPDFLPQDDSNYNSVRYYTAQDPYYYTIDNRPLEDLEHNLKSARSGGGDSARRAAALLGLNLGAVYSELLTTKGRTTAISGLQVIKTGNNSVRIMPGAYYDTRSISDSISDLTVKQALMSTVMDFHIPSPATGGTSIIYTIEGTFVELTQDAAANSMLPYIDPTNQFLPSTYTHGELRLSMVVGSSDITGTEVPALTTPGKFPIYNITLTQGSPNYKVQLHPHAPRGKVFARTIIPKPLSADGAVPTTLNEYPVLNMPKGVVAGISLSSIIHERELSPYLPIKLKIAFSPSMVGGEIAFRMRHRAFTQGELITNGSNSPLETSVISVVANGVQVHTTNISIPTSDFAGFVNGKWTVNRDFLNIVLERMSTSVLDTNPGDVRILSVTLIQ